MSSPESTNHTFYYYTILRANLIGLEGEGIKEIAETARIEDRNHFEALIPRIYELGGELPRDMKDFHDMSACPPAYLPSDPTDITAMLTVLVEAERCAVRGYTHVCNLTAGKDHRTYDLSLAILNEEIEHESWFSEFLRRRSFGTLFAARRDLSLCVQILKIIKSNPRGGPAFMRASPPFLLKTGGCGAAVHRSGARTF